jgi:hypothetical protein
MFFYVSLFVACVISSLLFLYLFNALADAGKAVYRAFLPSSKSSITGHVRNVRSTSTVNRTQTPWGWNGSDHGTREHNPKRAVTNGASGLDAFVNNHANETTSGGWLHREEKVELGGKAYKVTRRTPSRKTGAMTSSKQPWGW